MRCVFWHGMAVAAMPEGEKDQLSPMLGLTPWVHVTEVFGVVELALLNFFAKIDSNLGRRLFLCYGMLERNVPHNKSTLASSAGLGKHYMAMLTI